MATPDAQIHLAEGIAARLPEVTRNEWMRWMQVASRHGLEEAIRHAEQISTDVTIRPAIQRANRLIARAVKEHQGALRSLGEQDRKVVLGYVSWLLRTETLRGSLDSRG